MYTLEIKKSNKTLKKKGVWEGSGRTGRAEKEQNNYRSFQDTVMRKQKDNLF